MYREGERAEKAIQDSVWWNGPYGQSSKPFSPVISPGQAQKEDRP